MIRYGIGVDQPYICASVLDCRKLRKASCTPRSSNGSKRARSLADMCGYVTVSPSKATPCRASASARK